MQHLNSITRSRPVNAYVQQGPFLSILEVALGALVKRLQDKKAEKEAPA